MADLSQDDTRRDETDAAVPGPDTSMPGETVPATAGGPPGVPGQTEKATPRPSPQPREARGGRWTLGAIAVAVAVVLVAALAIGAMLARGPADGGDTTVVPTPTPAWPQGAILVAAANSADPGARGAAHRCDGTDDQVEIQRALDEAGVNGGTVVLLDGTFRCTDKLNPRTGTTLMGLGPGQTTLDVQGYYKPIELLQDSVVLQGFKITGRGFVLVRASHVLVENVEITTMQKGKVEANGAFFVFAKDSVIQDVEFRNCTAIDCGIHGFNVNGDGSPKETRDLRYIDCAAIRCGNADSRAIWATGFDFHETNDLYGITVIRCRAEDNWESGFHFEPGGHVTPKTVAEKIRMEDCVSIGNGQRNTKGYPYTDTFQSGYYVHNDAVLVNCTSEKNRNAGFFVHGGRTVTFENCSDVGSTYGWKVVKDSHDVTLEGCRTAGNLEWGLWAADAKRLVLDGFEQRGVRGKDGYQSMLGWYYGNPAYEKPVTSSRFEIAADGSLPAINQAGANNQYEVTRL